ncbi:MAG: efflux RND transporter permease subunit [Pseudomonadota bacterium]
MLDYFARHPNAANLLMIAAIMLGLLALPGMERETFPEFTPSKVTVSVVYSGASAEEVDETICLELDDALTGVDALEEAECVSVDNLATATLTMAEGGDLSAFYNDALSAASSLSLPEDAEAPTVAIQGRSETIALLAVSGLDGHRALVAYADRLAARLRTLPMVSEATVGGVSDAEFKIVFDQAALRRYGVDARRLADEIAGRSLSSPLGQVETRDRDFALRYDDARRDRAPLEDLIVLQNATGGFVRLRDVATVSLGEAETERRAAIDGRRAAIISISKTKDDDAIEAFAEVRALIDAEEARYPDPFAITVINDTTEAIDERVSLILSNTLQGLVLVFIVMALFFSMREALWISAALPVSFLGGLFALSLVGVTINMISLVALLMAVGLIMDDSIVIADNIAKWRERLSPADAAVRGVREVAPGVFSSFLTTACVFGPLMVLSGEMGAILQVIPVVLLITLSVSLVEAFLVLPRHLSHGGGHGAPALASAAATRPPRWAPAQLERFVERRLAPTVERLIRWRYLTLGSVFALLIVTVGLMASGVVKLIGFPTIEGDTIEARIALASGAPLERTEAAVAQILEGLERVNAGLTPSTDGAAPLVTRVLMRYATNADVKDAGAHTATITVDLLSSERRNISADDVAARWRAASGPLPEVAQSSFAQTTRGPGGQDVDIALSAPDLATLDAASAEMLARLRAVPHLSDIYRDFRGGRPEIRITLKDLGYTIGLTPDALSSQLRAAFAGFETDDFRIGPSAVSVRLELADSVPTVSELEQFPISVGEGRQAALGVVAAVEIVDAYAQITRERGLPTARILGDVDQAAITSAEVAAIALDRLAPEIQRLYPGVEIGIGGATEDQQKTQSSIVSALLAGLVGVYLILAFQFRSYALPAVVMLSIPFAAIGSVGGHLAFGAPVSMPSIVGFASLAGVVVNNAILFVAAFERAARAASVAEAAVAAMRRRFQPVLLSSLTTFVGLLPILFETSPQAQVLAPLVISVAFGLAASTALIVLALPPALVIYFDFFDPKRWLDQHGPQLPAEPATDPAAQT